MLARFQSEAEKELLCILPQLESNLSRMPKMILFSAVGRPPKGPYSPTAENESGGTVHVIISELHFSHGARWLMPASTVAVKIEANASKRQNYVNLK